MFDYFKNDKDAEYSKFYTDEFGPLYKFLRRDFDEPTSQDIVHDSFAELYEKWYYVNNKKAWIYSVTKKRALNYSDHKKVEKRNEKGYLIDNLNSGYAGALFGNEELSAFIENLKKDIDPELIEYLDYLSYGKKQIEIASILNVSQKTVSKKLSKVKDYVKNYLEKYGISKISKKG